MFCKKIQTWFADYFAFKVKQIKLQLAVYKLFEILFLPKIQILSVHLYFFCTKNLKKGLKNC